MPERHTKHLMFRHDGVCRSPACVKGETIKAGTFGWWAVGGIVWHEGCPEPKEMLSVPISEEEESARIDAWMDRKIEEEAKRRSAGASGEAGTINHQEQHIRPVPPSSAPVSVTSDPKFEEVF